MAKLGMEFQNGLGMLVFRCFYRFHWAFDGKCD